MLRKLSVFLVAWHCLATTSGQEAKQVTITATLIKADSTTPRAMVFNFLNPFIRTRKSASFEGGDQLKITGEMLFRQNMTVQYNGSFINLLVKPGDSVHLEIDGSKIKKENFDWLTISGDNAQISTEVNQWHHYFNTSHFKDFGPASSIENMKDSVRRCYQQYIQVLDSFSKARGMSTATYQWALNDLKYTVSYFAAGYLTTKDSASGKLHYNHALYRDSLFDQYSSNGFQSMMFPYHLMNYSTTLLKTDTTIRINKLKGNYKAAAGKAIQLIMREPKGITRDYMLFSTLNSYLEASPFLLDSIPNTASYFSTPLAYKYLLNASSTARHPSLTERSIEGLTFLDRKKGKTRIARTEIFNHFKRIYPGKIIYLDVYATWCVPCLQEMEYTPALKKQTDTSKIVFINICLQSTEQNWIDLVSRKDLQGENYFLDDDASKLFMGMYQVGGFPTYMLIDGQGKLITRTAPRPSEGYQFLQAINKLLKVK
ncbi:TlpA family protein disulfide reductase [Terrimonas sp. NA20]|uniref:TlpA family protein disulfide reductase n=1 Tax=Terrimonas ginsenosidimutans TaxID=2908004 RepID=A0ABS9KU31_9BACT|nr:TlpA disulfide reductase family protein [Terrimonas ginsenosidimutans]MCG2615833.1 TlpA family protein disulfide reductase [Terrimonas ginsenosidimutans]